jgi:hypothetical protein
VKKMNTNIITPRLAKVVGLETKQCFAVIKRNSGAHRSIMMGLATGVLLASVGMAAAQPRNHLRAEQFYSIPQSPNQVVPSRLDRIRYDHSGTRGRDGLGASPWRPEGPGNVSD